ncbi:MAG: hypothetical protein OXC05_12730 [Halieaceae bacterium]|nr:hypothetical protein [Halieaceae bacterium]
MNWRHVAAGFSLLAGAAMLGGCVTASVDELVFTGVSEQLGDASVVVLGRRHASDYETEPEFVACVGKHISRGANGITVVSEQDFVDALYPWFEPRTAPMHPADINRLLEVEPLRQALSRMKTAYIVWVDGKTTRSDSMGSMACGIGVGGAGCFGFGTWDDVSEYEAVIWDFTRQREVGRIGAAASGQSYMPALVVPIPIIAPVKGTACDGIGEQLLQFFSTK